MEIDNERELRCMLFGMTVGRALNLSNTSLTSKDMYFGDYDKVCLALYRSINGLAVLSDCDEERDALTIEGAMRVSKIEARHAWRSIFEYSDDDK